LTEVTLDFLGAQMERLLSEMRSIHTEIESMRGDIHVLTAIVMRHDGSLSAIIDQLRAMAKQQNQFNSRLRALEDVR